MASPIQNLRRHKGVTVLKVFMPTCGHCQDYAPTFEAVSSSNTNPSVVFAEIDGSDEKLGNELKEFLESVCSYQITGVPTTLVVSRSPMPEDSALEVIPCKGGVYHLGYLMGSVARADLERVVKKAVQKVKSDAQQKKGNDGTDLNDVTQPTHEDGLGVVEVSSSSNDNNNATKLDDLGLDNGNPELDTGNPRLDNDDPELDNGNPRLDDNDDLGLDNDVLIGDLLDQQEEEQPGAGSAGSAKKAKGGKAKKAKAERKQKRTKKQASTEIVVPGWVEACNVGTPGPPGTPGVLPGEENKPVLILNDRAQGLEGQLNRTICQMLDDRGQDRTCAKLYVVNAGAFATVWTPHVVTHDEQHFVGPEVISFLDSLL